MLNFFRSKKSSLGILRQGPAMRVVFFYAGEEGTYIDHAEVTLYENGIIHIRSKFEETTAHLQNCEIQWAYVEPTDSKDAGKDGGNVRVLDPRKSRAESPRPEVT